jgi:hypothetical protein
MAELKSRRTEKLDSTLTTILAELDCDNNPTRKGKERKGKERKGDRARAKCRVIDTQWHRTLGARVPRCTSSPPC